MPVVPRACCLALQLRLIKSSIVARYSGQQKFATSSRGPTPPPPAERPNPLPLPPVSATVLPSRTSAPFVGVRLLGSLASTLLVGVLRGGALVGSTIAGVWAAGGRTGSTAFFVSVICWMARPPRVARPPSRGPTAPPRLI